MARKANGTSGRGLKRRGRTFALRFRAYGKRRYVTLGTARGLDTQRAEEELANVLADVRRGIWRPPDDEITEASRLSRSQPSTSSPPNGLSLVATSSPPAPPRTTHSR